ncbi:deoxynucleoside kinase [Riemerella anatipestifer]|uniref:Deoxynucleoside kinase n=2 Tax=Riemerella anatipestifer TaxID=34085 RepID=A0AAP6HEY5_RIEAN|nr:deoxynucleoside kinase [Riemerella anatipestifer]ADQ81311.1 deoxynucleoside kinase [Riemerella anatipestifer ATCC 11845 = DSM 15868]ADZ11206.1 Deoxynucleoside kinase [Riemerella anatipestifer RA-GD]AFD55330.1 deoxynucleoside kinase [Riemerella anatipestifer ATCC 11845 = DSM 15868]AGC40796.1 Deoxynucleoside kinase [Riemerella anatipestifer RA-CH-2]AKP68616.1 deoxynucleoside kinase [Riemerella anatipestifer]
MHIAVTGNIGAGKTTLTKMLAKHYGWEAQFEDVDDNPYLDDFYHDMSKWSFALQIYFLGSRFRQVKEIRESGKNIIQDRTIYEDAHIFAENLNEMQLLSDRDYKNYTSLFELMKTFVSAPDLLIYLRASVPKLVGQIAKRGRDYEAEISIDYLSKLNNKYESWIQNYKEGKLLIIEVDDLDFVERPEDFGSILERIDGQLNGLF